VSGVLPPLKVTIKGKSFDIETVTRAMSDAVMERTESLRSTVKTRSAVLR
jgi:hypothetical protein